MKRNLTIAFIGHHLSGKSTLATYLSENYQPSETKTPSTGSSATKETFILQTGLPHSIRELEFESQNFFIAILDAPCYDYLPSFMSSVSQADAAIVVVSSWERELDSYTRPEGWLKNIFLLAYIAGIRQFLICISKIDVQFSEEKYHQLRREVSDLLIGLPISPLTICFVPVSGQEGTNIFERSNWYEGPTLTEAIDNNFKSRRRTTYDQPLRMSISLKLNTMPVVLAKVESGVLKQHAKLHYGEKGKEVVASSLKRFQNDLQEALTGDIVEIHLTGIDQKNIKNVCFLSEAEGKPLRKCKSFIAQVNFFNIREEIYPESEAKVLFGGQIASCKLSQFFARVHKVTGESIEDGPACFQKDQTGLILIKALESLSIEPFEEDPAFGRFLILSEYNCVIAAGVVKEVFH